MTNTTRYYAVVDPTSAFAQEWREWAGIDSVPVVEDVPRLRTIDGQPRLSYLIDLGALDLGTFDDLVMGMARKFRSPFSEVLEDVLDKGLPVLAEHVRICLDPDEGRAWYAERRLP